MASALVVLETERLLLRVFHPTDLDAFAPIEADPEVMRFYPSGPRPREWAERGVRFFIGLQAQHGSSLWAMIHKVDDRFIGYCGLLPQAIHGADEVVVGYKLAQTYWGHGLATEAARACCDWGFSHLTVPRLISIIDPGNAAARPAASMSCVDRSGSGAMFELRPATDEDYAFLWHVAATTMRGYVESIRGWDEAWQEQRSRAKFDASKWQIITVEGQDTERQDAGGMSAGRHADSISLDYLYILPSFQGQGIGSAVVQRLIAEAYSAGVPLTLDVLRSNPNALRLYERLGLWVVDENDERFFMSTDAEGNDGP